MKREGRKEENKEQKRKEEKEIGKGVNLPQFRVGVGRRKQHKTGSA